jgi:hypothetical protein
MQATALSAWLVDNYCSESGDFAVPAFLEGGSNVPESLPR